MLFKIKIYKIYLTAKRRTKEFVKIWKESELESAKQKIKKNFKTNIKIAKNNKVANNLKYSWHWNSAERDVVNNKIGIQEKGKKRTQKVVIMDTDDEIVQDGKELNYQFNNCYQNMSSKFMKHIIFKN